MNTIKFQGTESIHKTLVFLCTNNKLVGKKKNNSENNSVYNRYDT